MKPSDARSDSQLPVLVVGTFLSSKLFDAQGNQNYSGYMAVALKLVDPLRMSLFCSLIITSGISLPRYDGATVVSRSIDLKQPVIFVSMNYR